MEAYRVLSKKSSRDAYDLGMSGHGQSPNSYYQANYRERNVYDRDFEMWRQRMNNMNKSQNRYQNPNL